MLIGHQKVLSFFQEAIAHHSLGHSYCLIGPDQVGKRTLAQIIAAQLLSIPMERLATHADFFYVERLYDEKSGKRKKEIVVEQARTLKAKLQTTSWFSGWRVIIIDEVELMNEETSNALLKILEEPPERTLFFLLTTNDNLLLPTIRSRTQCISLSTVSSPELQAGLIEQGITPSEAKELVELSWGRPGRALHLAHQPEILQETREYWLHFDELTQQPIYERFKRIESWVGGKKEDTLSREEIDHLLELWIMWWYEQMNTFKKNMVATVSILDSIFHARILLQKNINPKLLLENIVLQW